MYMKLFSTHLIEPNICFQSILCKTGGEQPVKFEILIVYTQEIEYSTFHHMTYIVYSLSLISHSKT